jgi:RND family efflux transporter MFP subunit
MDQVKKNKLKALAQIGLALLLLSNLYTYYKSKHHALDIPIPNVIIKNPQLIDMAVYITQTGNTVAYNSVDLVARVEGYLNEINFIDGTYVKKGTTLFVIEPEPYLAKLNEAKASLAAQKAIYEYDKSEYARQKRMYSQNATSLNNVEKWLAKSQESIAEVEEAKENVIMASINYSYTHVEAPFDGRIGRHLIDKGNLVGNSTATNLATIEQFNQIYVYFNLNEIDLLELRKSARARGVDEKLIRQIPVSVSLQNNANFKFEGKLDFVNTGLDASTGTMQFRALLPNKELILLPGLYVQVRMMIDTPTPRLTIPDIAIQYDQIGSYVLLVNKNNLVELKRVTLGGVENGQRAVLSGITKTDQVIVDGLQNATPGNQVNPQFEKKT